MLHGGGHFGNPPRRRYRPGQSPRLAAVGRDPRGCGRDPRRAAGSGEHPPRSRLRLGYHPRASARARTTGGDLAEGQAGPAKRGHEAVGDRAHQLLVAQRPQEACVVHGEEWAGHRLLGGVLGCRDHRKATHPGRLETLPLGGQTFSLSVTY
jgi:hypothetical protein